MKMKSFGFTLMELMIVVAILGILAALAYPQYIGYVEKGKRAECRSALLVAAQKMEKFYSNNNRYPVVGAAGLAEARIAANSNDGNPGASCTIAITDSVLPTGTPTPTPASYRLRATATYPDRSCTSFTLNETSTKDAFGPNPVGCWR